MTLENNNAKSIGMDKAFSVSALIAIIALVVTGLSFSKEGFWESYFFGWIFGVCLCVGCLGLTLLHHTVRGAWGLSILRLIEAGGSWISFFVMGLGFLPIAFQLKLFYPWADEAKVAADHVLHFRAHDLTPIMQMTPTAFLIRSVFYFVIWMVLAAVLRKSSVAQDANGDNKLAEKRTTISAPGIVLFFIVTTMAFTDWVMSIQKHWFSTMIGAWMIVGSVLTILAICNIIVMSNATKQPYSNVMNKGLSKDLGNWLFVFTLLWAYTSFSQFVIIWAGNLPEFISFYHVRMHAEYQIMGVALIFAQFLVPFVALLAPRTKADPKLLRNIAVWVLLWRFVDMYWIMVPHFREEFKFQLTDVVGLALFLALWFAVFANQLRKGNVLPTHDPRLKEAYSHA